MKRIVAFIILLSYVITLLTACSGGLQGIGETGISAEEFDSLRLGMSSQKVIEIIGGGGESISESKEEDDNYYIYRRLYRYEGENGGYAELEYTQKVAKDTFRWGTSNNPFNSELTSKTNYNLK